MQGGSEPVWTPDGGRVITSIGERPEGGLLMQMADGSRPADTLLTVADGVA
mgnify:CR=1 FL=1